MRTMDDIAIAAQKEATEHGVHVVRLKEDDKGRFEVAFMANKSDGVPYYSVVYVRPDQPEATWLRNLQLSVGRLLDAVKP
jgi:hypothetical protein